MPTSTKQDNKTGKDHKSEDYFNPEMFKSLFERLLKFDREDIAEKHRKNISSTNDMQKMAFETIKNIFQLQTQLMRHNFEEINSSMRELMNDPTSKEKLSSHANTLKKTMSNTLNHHSDISDILLKSNMDIYKIIQERFKENTKGFQHKSDQSH